MDCFFVSMGHLAIGVVAARSARSGEALPPVPWGVSMVYPFRLVADSELCDLASRVDPHAVMGLTGPGALALCQSGR